MAKTRIGTGTARRTLRRRYERVTHNSSARGFVDDGHREGRIELLVDVEGLIAHLGERALGGKSGVAKLAFGLIEARVIRGTVTDHRKKTSEHTTPRSELRYILDDHAREHLAAWCETQLRDDERARLKRGMTAYLETMSVEEAENTLMLGWPRIREIVEGAAS